MDRTSPVIRADRIDNRMSFDVVGTDYTASLSPVVIKEPGFELEAFTFIPVELNLFDQIAPTVVHGSIGLFTTGRIVTGDMVALLENQPGHSVENAACPDSLGVDAQMLSLLPGPGAEDVFILAASRVVFGVHPFMGSSIQGIVKNEGFHAVDNTCQFL
ncbi:hypothetical protein D3C87_1642290 [compost metagenome]